MGGGGGVDSSLDAIDVWNTPSWLREVSAAPPAHSQIAFSPLPCHGASVIDTLANPKIRLDSVKRMTEVQNTS